MANPVITLLGSSPLSITPAQAASYTDAGATASDAEDGDISGSITVLGSVGTSAGQYLLFYNVADSGGNRAATVIRTVLVQSTASAATYDLEWKVTGQSSTAVNGLATTIYNLTGRAQNTSHEFRVRGVSAGALQGAWTGWSQFNTLADTVKPVITLVGSTTITINTTQAATWTDPGATATDNVSGNLTESIVATGTVGTTVGTYYRYYNVTDGAGNAANQVTRTINVVAVDSVAPVVTLNGSRIEQLALNDTWVDAGATAVDNIDGALSVTVVQSINSAVAGVYPVEYKATDAQGNVGRSFRFVEVAPSGAPDSYDLEWKIRGGTATAINTIVGITQGLTGLTSGAGYEWRARATKAGTSSAWSAWSAFPTDIITAVSAQPIGGGLLTVTATVANVTTEEGANITFSGTCDQENAIVRVSVAGQLFATRASGGVWSVTTNFSTAPTGAVLLDTLDELVSPSAILLDGDAQTGTDKLLWE